MHYFVTKRKCLIKECHQHNNKCEKKQTFTLSSLFVRYEQIVTSIIKTLPKNLLQIWVVDLYHKRSNQHQRDTNALMCSKHKIIIKLLFARMKSILSSLCIR